MTWKNNILNKTSFSDENCTKHILYKVGKFPITKYDYNSLNESQWVSDGVSNRYINNKEYSSEQFIKTKTL